MNSTQTKQIAKVYKKSFSLLYKDFFKDTNIGLKLFVEYLRYLRDLVTCDVNNEESIERALTKMAIITTAIAEFDAYERSKDTYNSQQKVFHWNNFCELLKQNMEEWLTIDDTI